MCVHKIFVLEPEEHCNHDQWIAGAMLRQGSKLQTTSVVTSLHFYSTEVYESLCCGGRCDLWSFYSVISVNGWCSFAGRAIDSHKLNCHIRKEGRSALYFWHVKAEVHPNQMFRSPAGPLCHVTCLVTAWLRSVALRLLDSTWWSMVCWQIP